MSNQPHWPTVDSEPNGLGVLEIRRPGNEPIAGRLGMGVPVRTGGMSVGGAEFDSTVGVGPDPRPPQPASHSRAAVLAFSTVRRRVIGRKYSTLE
jgi:hypothetical protein